MKTGDYSLLSASCRLAYSQQVEPHLRGGLRILTHLHSSEKCKGHAGALMARLCALADAAGITLMLEPMAEGAGMNTQELTDWYSERFGFFTLQVAVPGRRHLMVRLPYEVQPVDRFRANPLAVAAEQVANGR